MTLTELKNRNTNSLTVVLGYLHKAPSNAFRVPWMVAPFANSPFLGSSPVAGKPVSIVAAYYKPDNPEFIEVVLSTGDLYVTKVAFDKGWLTPVMIDVSDRESQEQLMWFIHDLKEGV